MPHAASGRLQLDHAKPIKGLVKAFQCRTRQVVGCNRRDIVMWGETSQSFNAARGKWSVATQKLDGPATRIGVSMPHAASGRLQLKTLRLLLLI